MKSPARTVAAAPAPSDEQAVRILLVDDEDGVREAIALLMRRLGHVVTCAASGRAALDVLATGLTVDLVITDLGMPDLDGWAFAHRVRKRWPDVRIGVITGWGEQAEGPRGRDAVEFILGKPVDRRTLAAAIAAATRERVGA